MPIWIIVAYCIVVALCAFGAAKLYSAGTPMYGKAIVATMVAYAILFAAIWIFGVSVPAYTLLLTMLTAFISCFFGHYLQYYNKSHTFDRYLHAFGTFSFALLAYCVLDDFVLTGGSRIYQALFITFLGNTLGVIFEMSEMMQDFKHSPVKCQKGLLDTNMDELGNLVGSILAGAFAYIWLLP